MNGELLGGTWLLLCIGLLVLLLGWRLRGCAAIQVLVRISGKFLVPLEILILLHPTRITFFLGLGFLLNMAEFYYHENSRYRKCYESKQASEEQFLKQSSCVLGVP